MPPACVEPLPLYRPRDPQASDLWRLLDRHLHAIANRWLGRFVLLDVTDNHLQFAVAVFFAKVGFRLRRGSLRVGLQELLNVGNRLPIEHRIDVQVTEADEMG